MEEILEFVKGFNLQTIISLAVIVYFFFNNLKSEIKLLEAKIDSQTQRTDRLYEMFVSLQKETKDIVIDILKEKR